MRITREQTEEDFASIYVELSAAAAAEGERLNKLSTWQAFVLERVNNKLLRPEAMHWPVPRIRRDVAEALSFG